MLETERGLFLEESGSLKESKETKSDFVNRCEEIIALTKEKVIQEIEDFPMDMELKTNLSALVGEHFRSIYISDFANASSLNIVLLGSKLSDGIREFRSKIIVEGNNYRQTGTEMELLPKVSDAMMKGGLEIEKAIIERNAKTNQ